MKKDKIDFKEIIGHRISSWVIAATGVLGICGLLLAISSIWLAPDKTEGLREAKEILQFIFTALLPLWGTWIGTVLAYYFSKENFESANKSVRELVGNLNLGDKLKSVKVTDVMMPYDKIKKIEVPPGENGDALVVNDIYQKLATENIRRALIFKEGAILYALHKSILSDFILRNHANAATATVAQLKADPDKDIQNSIKNGAPTLNKDATLLDAKLLMESFEGCQDVFITETGKKTEKVMGWVSNIDIFNHSKA